MPDQIPLYAVHQPGVKQGYRTARPAEYQLHPADIFVITAVGTPQSGTFEIPQFLGFCQNFRSGFRTHIIALPQCPADGHRTHAADFCNIGDRYVLFFHIPDLLNLSAAESRRLFLQLLWKYITVQQENNICLYKYLRFFVKFMLFQLHFIFHKDIFIAQLNVNINKIFQESGYGRQI
jgi:hypothetical protein